MNSILVKIDGKLRAKSTLRIKNLNTTTDYNAALKTSRANYNERLMTVKGNLTQ